MTKQVPITEGWAPVCPGTLILRDRYLWLEGGRLQNVEWWRMVITDGSSNANAVRTGITLWEAGKGLMSETGAKEFFSRFGSLRENCPKESYEAMSRVIWEALLEVDRHRVVGGDPNVSLAGQLERLEKLSKLGETCIEVVMRMLVYTPDALEVRRLETAIKYATDQNKHRR
jgi:hypothetical protein